MENWASDGVDSDGLALWLDQPLLELRRGVDPVEAAAVCQVLSDALSTGSSWSAALAAASTLGPRSLRASFAAAAEVIARGAGVNAAARELPAPISGWVCLAANSSDAPGTLSRAARAFEAQHGWKRAPRLWLPGTAALLALLALLAWLVGGVLTPAVTAASSEETLPWSVRYTPVIAALVALLAAGAALAVVLVFRRLVKAGAPTMAAHMLSTPALQAPWSQRLHLAAVMCDQPDLAVAAEQVASGTALKEALLSTDLAAATPAMTAGATPESAFSAVALATDAHRLRLAASMPAVLTWSALPVAVVILTGTVLGVVIPLLELVRP